MWPRPLRVGTDFSGIDAVILALEFLGVPYEYLFASERGVLARDFLRKNHKPQHLYSDVAQRPAMPGWELDLYGASPPCQSFSAAGPKTGLGDARGRLFFEAVMFIERSKPKTFFVENSAELLKRPHAALLSGVLQRLRDASYWVQARTLNAGEHGLPHNRPRTFLVGVRLDCKRRDIVLFAPPIAPLSLAATLSPWKDGDDTAGLPPLSAPVARAIVQRAKDRAAWIQGDWMVDCGASRAWANCRPRLVCPCLTRARKHGHWIGSRGRYIELLEATRMQGILRAEKLRWPASEGECFQLLGNSIAGCVLHRLLPRLLYAASLGEVQDPWDTGRAQAAFRTWHDKPPARKARPTVLDLLRARSAPQRGGATQQEDCSRPAWDTGRAQAAFRTMHDEPPVSKARPTVLDLLRSRSAPQRGEATPREDCSRPARMANPRLLQALAQSSLQARHATTHSGARALKAQRALLPYVQLLG